MSEKALPSSLDSEGAVIAKMMLEPDCVADIKSELVNPKVFWGAQHQDIAGAIFDLHTKAKGHDYAAILEWLTRNKRLKKNFGNKAMAEAYLLGLPGDFVGDIDHELHCRVVKDCWQKREIIRRAGEMVDGAMDPETPVSRIISDTSSMMMELSTDTVSGSAKTMGDVYERVKPLLAEGGIAGIRSGYGKLDYLTNGWKPGQLIVVGARPGEGKSALLTNLAVRLAPAHPLVFTLEMTEREIWCRMVAIMARVDSRMYESGQLVGDDLKRAGRAAEALSHMPIMVDDPASISIDAIESRARKECSRGSVGCIMIDYIGLVKSDAVHNTRQLLIGDMTRRLKVLARELSVPIFLASQLNRDSKKENRSPSLSDLREAGDLEQDADQVIFLHWPDGEDEHNTQPKVSIKVAKNRGGPIGTVNMKYARKETRFFEEEDYVQASNQGGTQTVRDFFDESCKA